MGRKVFNRKRIHKKEHNRNIVTGKYTLNFKMIRWVQKHSDYRGNSQ